MGKLMEEILAGPASAPEEPHLSDYELACLAEGVLEESRREDCWRHLLRCPRCYEVLENTLQDLAPELLRRRGFFSRISSLSYAVAAAIILVILAGGGLWWKGYFQGSPVLVASVTLDAPLKQLLLADDDLVWTDAPRLERLKALLRRQGIKVGKLEKVVLKAPYYPTKALPSPEEKVRIKIEHNTAYLEVLAAGNQPSSGRKDHEP